MAVKTLAQLKADLEQVELAASNIREQIQNKERSQLLRCGKCKMGHELRELVYINELWWRDDDWHHGDGAWKCVCGTKHSLRDTEFSKRGSELFKEVLDVYPDRR